VTHHRIAGSFPPGRCRLYGIASKEEGQGGLPRTAAWSWGSIRTGIPTLRRYATYPFVRVRPSRPHPRSSASGPGRSAPVSSGSAPLYSREVTYIRTTADRRDRHHPVQQLCESEPRALPVVRDEEAVPAACPMRGVLTGTHGRSRLDDRNPRRSRNHQVAARQRHRLPKMIVRSISRSGASGLLAAWDRKGAGQPQRCGKSRPARRD
jgi:hypothetical protein